MADIKFRDTAHRDFFLENMMKCRVNDCYHRAFFYVMGIASETRANINQMFNFKEDCIGQRVCTAAGRQAEQLRSAILLLTFGTGMQRKGRNDISRQRSCSAVSLLPTLWRVSRSDTPNIAGSFLLPENRRKFQDKKGKAYEEL